MICIMLLLFIVAGQYANYKTECSSHHAENTFLCMRLNPRGLTPSMKEMDDRYKDDKSHKSKGIKSRNVLDDDTNLPSVSMDRIWDFKKSSNIHRYLSINSRISAYNYRFGES